MVRFVFLNASTAKSGKLHLHWTDDRFFVSSKKRILNDAVAAAREIYLDYRFRQKNGLPVISKRFADVAALCDATMK